jgi:hypothetical protein
LNQGYEYGVFSGSGSAMQSHIAKIEKKKETYKNGALNYSLTYVSTDWSAEDYGSKPVLGINFGK